MPVVRAISVSLCAALLLLGCGGAQKKGPAFKPVSDADLGRLAPEQMAPVNAARADVGAARDAAARAELRLQEARHEEGYARADVTAAQADAQRAQAEQRAAQESGDTTQLARARSLSEAAKLRRQAADAHHAYARELVEARQADVAARQAEIKVAEAELERARLAALQQANIPAASKYDAGQLEGHVVATRRSADGARASAARSEQEAQNALRAWRGLHERWQARVQGVGPTGTGSGTGTGSDPEAGGDEAANGAERDAAEENGGDAPETSPDR